MAVPLFLIFTAQYPTRYDLKLHQRLVASTEFTLTPSTGYNINFTSLSKYNPSSLVNNNNNNEQLWGRKTLVGQENTHKV